MWCSRLRPAGIGEYTPTVSVGVGVAGDDGCHGCPGCRPGGTSQQEGVSCCRVHCWTGGSTRWGHVRQIPGRCSRCSNACSNAAGFAAVRERSPLSESLALLRIRTSTNSDERAAEVWGSRGRRFKSCHPDTERAGQRAGPLWRGGPRALWGANWGARVRPG